MGYCNQAHKNWLGSLIKKIGKENYSTLKKEMIWAYKTFKLKYDSHFLDY